VRHPDGTIKTFEYPGSIGTVALSINDKGLIARYYMDGRADQVFRGIQALERNRPD